MIILAL